MEACEKENGIERIEPMLDSADVDAEWPTATLELAMFLPVPTLDFGCLAPGEAVQGELVLYNPAASTRHLAFEKFPHTQGLTAAWPGGMSHDQGCDIAPHAEVSVTITWQPAPSDCSVAMRTTITLTDG
jgi:hypothetical protein